MTVDSQIFSVLSAATAVTGITSTRLYPLVAPQDSPTPYVVWQRVSTVTDGAHDADGTSDLFRSLFQFSCYATTFAEVDTLAAAVRAARYDYTAVAPEEVAAIASELTTLIFTITKL